MTAGFRRIAGLLGIAMLMVVAAVDARPAQAMSTIAFLSGLSDEELGQFQAWRDGRRNHQKRLDNYWSEVERKRSLRRKKRTPTKIFSEDDYVMSYAPDYKGPELSTSLRRKYNAFLESQAKDEPKTERKELPGIDHYLRVAKIHYNFVPERVSEAEFKRRYAAEALSLGLNRDQVVRVYALETGGIGTYDMQAGIHPLRKSGRPISSAIGYAQLLDANSVNEFYKHGSKIIARMKAKAERPGVSPERAALLKRKIASMRKMYANVRKLKYSWKTFQRYANTPEGEGVHVLNIDADVGPILQANKLRDVIDIAAKSNRFNLTGGELEIMNLAGPSTGLEMLQGAGRKAPTTNFFSRRSYYVNKMVIGLNGDGLLKELNRRMDYSVKTKGSKEFFEAFDTVERARAAR